MKKARMYIILLLFSIVSIVKPAEAYLAGLQPRVEQAKELVSTVAQTPQVQQAINYAQDVISSIKNKLLSKQWSKREQLALLASLIYLSATLRTAQSQELYGSRRGGPGLLRAFDPRRISSQLMGDVYNTQQWLGEKIASPALQ